MSKNTESQQKPRGETAPAPTTPRRRRFIVLSRFELDFRTFEEGMELTDEELPGDKLDGYITLGLVKEVS